MRFVIVPGYLRHTVGAGEPIVPAELMKFSLSSFDLDIRNAVTEPREVGAVRGLHMSVSKVAVPISPDQLRRQFAPGLPRFDTIRIEARSESLSELEEWTLEVARGIRQTRDGRLALFTLSSKDPVATIELLDLLPISIDTFDTVATGGYEMLRTRRGVTLAVGSFRFQ